MYLDTYCQQQAAAEAMQLNVNILNNKKVVMLNQFKKDHEQLRSGFDHFVRMEGTDLKSIKWVNQKFRETEV